MILPYMNGYGSCFVNLTLYASVLGVQSIFMWAVKVAIYSLVRIKSTSKSKHI